MTMQRPTHRVEQVGDAILREISRLLLLSVRDPRLNHVTITRVKMTADLKEAWIYYDWEGPEEERSDVEKALKKASGFFRHELSQLLSFKYVPRLFFHFDETRKIHDRAIELLDQSDEPPSSHDK